VSSRALPLKTGLAFAPRSATERPAADIEPPYAIVAADIIMYKSNIVSFGSVNQINPGIVSRSRLT
jgi:hypothetical protein